MPMAMTASSRTLSLRWVTASMTVRRATGTLGYRASTRSAELRMLRS